MILFKILLVTSAIILPVCYSSGSNLNYIDSDIYYRYSGDKNPRRDNDYAKYMENSLKVSIDKMQTPLHYNGSIPITCNITGHKGFKFQWGYYDTYDMGEDGTIYGRTIYEDMFASAPHEDIGIDQSYMTLSSTIYAIPSYVPHRMYICKALYFDSTGLVYNNRESIVINSNRSEDKYDWNGNVLPRDELYIQNKFNTGDYTIANGSQSVLGYSGAFARIVLYAVSYTDTEGSSAVIPCIGVGYDQPYMSWNDRVGKQISDDDDDRIYVDSKGSLVIKKMKMGDSGVYSCHAQNQYKEDIVFTNVRVVDKY